MLGPPVLNAIPFADVLCENIGMIGFLVIMFENGLSVNLKFNMVDWMGQFILPAAMVMTSIAVNVALSALVMGSFGIPAIEASIAATALSTMFVVPPDTGWLEICTKDDRGCRKEIGRATRLNSSHYRISRMPSSA